MRAYFVYGSGRISELGHVEPDNLDELLASAERSLAEPDVDRQFGLGVCRDDRDFAQITPVGNDQFLLWSDRTARKKGLLNFLSPPRPISPVLEGRVAALEALRNYMASTREDFEARYG